MDDVLQLILMKCDVLASARLIRASKALWNKYKYETLFWVALETDLLFVSKYIAFRAMNKHLGCRRRILKWTSYLDNPCSHCKCDMFLMCPPTFPIHVKLCNNCLSTQLITEDSFNRFVPYYIVLEMRHKLKHCWITPNQNTTRRVCAYYKPHVLAHWQFISFFLPEVANLLNHP
jgi:hypothetical protein